MATAVESAPVPRTDDALTPTASHFTIPRQPETHPDPPSQLSSSSIPPTRESSVAVSSEKRPLPEDEPAPAEAPHSANVPSLVKEPSASSSKADNQAQDEPQDANMDDDDNDGSDNENVDDDENRPAKKKRSQRFFCTEFPPCSLSFTRSEHLARHIRKHTGERPFQCHCLRRFSRLDNLRQHAQTVHVNEDIPGDSLAATGTRYQRQVRTERIRPAGHRQRPSTISTGSHSRGHSRNVSNSSIGSISDFGSPDDPRRRQQSIIMTPSTPPPPYYNYSPSGYSTPTSVFSAADPTSPRMASALGSPIALMPRSTIGWGGQNSSRRLSIPSGVPPFHASHAFAAPPTAPFVSHVGFASATPFSPTGSVIASPAHPHFGHSRHESLESAEAEWRRRTWHASTRSNVESRPATSGLTYQQRPDDPQPVSTQQPAAQQAVRLPGIDSFDRPHIQASAPPRRGPNEMDLDEVSQTGETEISSKRDSWSSMQQNLNQLDITQSTPPRDGGIWRHGTGGNPSPAVRPVTAPHSGFATPAPAQPGYDKCRDASGLSFEQPSTPKRIKRDSNWSYEDALAGGDAGPGPAVRTSPEGSSNSDELPTPSTSAAEYRPAIVHSNGYVEGQPVGIPEDAQKVRMMHHPVPQEAPGPDVASYAPIRSTFPSSSQGMKHGEDTGRLDALVAVATSEERAMSRQ